MGVSVVTGTLVDEAEAFERLTQAGLHVMKLEVPADDNEAHWHHFDAEFYILAGALQLTDVARGRVVDCPAGSRVILPARTLHAERSDGYTIVLGTSVPPEAFGEPVNRPATELDQTE